MALDLSALDDFTITSQTGVAAKAPLSKFEEDSNNPRFEFDDPEFEDFVSDIAERGILQPIVAYPVGDKLRIRFGARRYRAACRLNLLEIPYVITEDNRQFDDYAQIAENERRKNLQPLELATFIKKKLDQGDKKKNVAAKLKLDPSAITHLMSLVEAPDFLLELYHTGKCRAPHYLYELRKLYEKNASIVMQACTEAEDIDRAFIKNISHEIEPKVTELPLEELDQIVNEEMNIQSHDTENQTQYIQSHNPEIEVDLEHDSIDIKKIKKPLLLGIYDDREVMVILNKRPSVAGLVFIKYEDNGTEEEVSLDRVRLTLLADSKVT